ncbi:calcium-binding protein [Conexibacter stalactiti]|uniref:Calcium-binding protein n=1 Tax=Conexibacter stalactiti TaxID=1940611 RepID=A0ABU4HUT6_9ACTN|nr:calcium-binding protein [Conexibacter stalactiti]MDW5597053.1 calcium-binding protein [Conexibacter stalactiti]MEC5037695.1 calcium-binding protein [Conexibacter stalactiti]
MLWKRTAATTAWRLTPAHPGKRRRLPRSACALLAAVATTAVGAGAGVAQAATIVQEGDALVYRTAGERHSLSLNDSYPAGRLRFEDLFATITEVPASCTLVDANVADCAIPARVRVEFGDWDDTFGFGDGYGQSVAVEVFGGPGEDTLRGDFDRPGRELLDGGPDRDRIEGFGGDDELRGGEGDDILDGGAGADLVLGGGGDDTLAGDGQAAPGADRIDGGEGNDLLKDYVQTSVDRWPPANVSLDGVANDGRSGEGDDVSSVERIVAHVSGSFALSDGAEEVEVWANMDGGASTVLAGGGGDRVVGHDASERIEGGAGDDYLEGGKGHDTIVGGSGRDVIYGDETDTSCNPTFPESCVRYGNDVIDAHDGEFDQVDCGPGTDRAIVDEQDVVAVNCETIERRAAAATPEPGPVTRQPGASQPGTRQPGTGGGRPAVKRAISLTGRQSLRTVVRRGLQVKLTGAKPGRATIVVRFKGRVAGSARVRVNAKGAAIARVRLAKATTRSLARLSSARLVVSGAGLRATVTLKR